MGSRISHSGKTYPQKDKNHKQRKERIVRILFLSRTIGKNGNADTFQIVSQCITSLLILFYNTSVALNDNYAHVNKYKAV